MTDLKNFFDTDKAMAKAAPVSEQDAPLHDSIITISTNKLDADNYAADDLDGVTESLFGSGNLNYLMLQARQNDLAAINNGNNFFTDPQESSGLASLATQQRLLDALQENGDTPLLKNNAEDAAYAGSLGDIGTGNTSPFPSLALNSGFPSAGESSTNENSFLSQITNVNNTPPEHDPEPPTQEPPTQEPPTQEPPDSEPPVPDPDPNPVPPDVDVIGNNDLGLPIPSLNLDPVEDILGDIDVILDVTHGDDGLTIGIDTVLMDVPILNGDLNIDIPVLNPLIDTALDAATPAISTVTTLTQPVLDGVTDIIENILGESADLDKVPLLSALSEIPAAIEPVLETVSAVAQPVFDAATNLVEDIVAALPGEETLPALNLVSDTLDHLAPALDTLNQATAPVFEALNGLEPAVTEIVENVTSLTAPVTGLAGSLLTAVPETGEILSPGNLLDTVENASSVVDDITTAVAAPAMELADELSSAADDLVSATLEPAEEAAEALMPILGDVGNTLSGLFNGAPDTGDDIDLALHNDMGLPNIDINLDAVEALTGDIDILADVSHTPDSLQLGLDALVANIPLAEEDVLLSASGVDEAADPLLDKISSVIDEVQSSECLLTEGIELVACATDPLLGAAADSLDLACWPQIDTGNISAALGLGVLGEVTVDAATLLPDPVGNVAEGLGLLHDVGGDHGGGMLSGLSHGLRGGLFG